jgi:hypothetical protein
MSSQLDANVGLLAPTPQNPPTSTTRIPAHPRRVPDRPTNIGLRLPSLRKGCNDWRCWRAGNAELTWLCSAWIK